MAGLKGKSGRRSFYDEKAMAEVVNLSYRTIKSFLNSPEISLKDKAMVAQHFVVKSMPNKVEGSLDINSLVNAIHNTP